MRPRLLYRTVDHNGGLVFATEPEARRVARIHRAIEDARTWAEFRSLMSRRDYSEVLAAIDLTGERRPKGKDEFSGEGVPGWTDGEYPTWLQAGMDYVIPRKVLIRYGELKDTWLNGSYWHLPPEREQEIVRALESLGFEVERAQDLRFW